MANPWTVTPETVQYDLEFEGTPFWIALKKRLSAGEAKRLHSSGFRSLSQAKDKDGGMTDMEINVDYGALIFEKVRIYLTDWSLSDEGKKLPVKLDTLHALKPELFALFEQTVDKHVETMGELTKKASTPDSDLKSKKTSS